MIQRENLESKQKTINKERTDAFWKINQNRDTFREMIKMREIK